MINNTKKQQEIKKKEKRKKVTCTMQKTIIIETDHVPNALRSQ